MKKEYIQKRRAEKQRKQRLTWISIAAVILLIVGGVFLGKRSSGLPPVISVTQAYEKYQNGALMLDVRSQDAWEQAHIPNSVLIPLEQLPNRLDELPKDQEIVMICRTGNRSQIGREVLLEAGFKKVTSMDGGMVAWTVTGYPVDAQNQ